MQLSFDLQTANCLTLVQITGLVALPVTLAARTFLQLSTRMSTISVVQRVQLLLRCRLSHLPERASTHAKKLFTRAASALIHRYQALKLHTCRVMELQFSRCPKLHVPRPSCKVFSLLMPW